MARRYVMGLSREMSNGQSDGCDLSLGTEAEVMAKIQSMLENSPPGTEMWIGVIVKEGETDAKETA